MAGLICQSITHDVDRPTGNMSVAAVTKADDLEQSVIVTNRAASK
jgi:hypothetical protein